MGCSSGKENIISYFNFLSTSNHIAFSQLKNKTFYSLLRSYFDDEKLMSLFALPVFGNGGLPASTMHAFSGAKIFSEFILDGGYYPEGGIQTIPDTLAFIIEQNCGRLLYRRSVKKILVDHNIATGVRLDTGDSVIAKYIISACDVTQTFKKLFRKKNRRTAYPR